jgi:hypothetical protein
LEKKAGNPGHANQCERREPFVQMMILGG